MQETYSGYVYVPEAFVKNTHGSSRELRKNWVKCWARLMAFELKLWTNYEYSADGKDADYAIGVNRVSAAFFGASGKIFRTILIVGRCIC